MPYPAHRPQSPEVAARVAAESLASARQVAIAERLAVEMVAREGYDERNPFHPKPGF